MEKTYRQTNIEMESVSSREQLCKTNGRGTNSNRYSPELSRRSTVVDDVVACIVVVKKQLHTTS